MLVSLYPTSTHRLPLLFCLLIASYFAQAGSNKAHFIESKNADILMRAGADESWEECFKFKAGDTLDYSLRSPQPLNFNIHYHRENTVNYPVKTTLHEQTSGSFTAPETDTYCFMWGNTEQQKKSFVVHFEFNLRKP
jgi:hypothetical protein